MLNFNYYYGDNVASPDINWLSDFWVPIFGAALGAGVTILAVYLTSKESKKAERKRAKQLRKDELIYFQLLVNNIIKIWESQVRGLRPVHLIIHNDTINLPLVSKSTKVDFERFIHRVNQEKYYLNYIQHFGSKKEIVKEFNDIYEGVEYFDANIDALFESLAKSNQYDHERKIRLRKLLDDCMDEATRIMNKLSFNDAEEMEIRTKINFVIFTFYAHRSDDFGFQYYIDNFIGKLLPELVKYSHRPVLVDLSLQMKSAVQIYNEILQLNSFVGDEVHNEYKNLKSTLKLFKDKCERIQKYNP